MRDLVIISAALFCEFTRLILWFNNKSITNLIKFHDQFIRVEKSLETKKVDASNSSQQAN